jgi:hypothetical protein
MSFSRFTPLVLTFLAAAASAGTPGIDLEVTVGTDLGEGACAAATSLDALVGEEVNFCYRVTNNTATTLEYQSLDDSIEGSLLSEHALTIAPGATVQYNRIRQLSRSQSGGRTLTWTARDVRPDYTAAPRAGAFIDLSTSPTAQALNPASDASDPTGIGMVQVEVPFTFDFYGVASNRLCVGMDGVAQVGVDRCILFPIAPGPLPQGGMGPSMAPLWDDFAGWVFCGDDCIDLYGAVFADTVGAAPNRQFVVEWYNVRHEMAAANEDRATFELVIDEATGTISFEYLDVEYTAFQNFFEAPDVCDGGVCAGIGLQQDDAWAESYSWDEASVTDNSAIDWIPNAPATYAASATVTLDVGAPVAAPPASIAGAAPAGGATSVALTLANTGDRDLVWTLDQGTPGAAAGATVPAYVSRMLLADYPTMDNTLLGFDAAAPSAPATIGPVHRIYDAGAFVDDDFSTEYLVSGWREIGGTHIFKSDILERVDTATAEITPVGDTGVGGSEYIAALAWDPTTSTLYAAITGNGGTSTLATIDRYDGSVTRLAPIEGPDVVAIIGLAIDAEGQMFALDQNSVSLMSVDKTTGVATPIGPIGEDVLILLNGSLAFDRARDILYMIGTTQDVLGGDYIVDLVSGHADLVGTIGADQELNAALAIATPGGPCTNAAPAPWLSFDPDAGTVAAGDATTISVGLDATGLAEGRYEADLCVRSNDPYRHTFPVHVTFDVGGSDDTIFASGFDAP